MLRRFLVLVLGIILLSACTRKEEGITVYLAGDLLLDRGVREHIDKEGVKSLFRYVSPLFHKADFVIANLECPVTERKAPVNKRFVFRGEPEWLPAVREAGITHLVIANNHTYDQGRRGLEDTYQNIQSAGMEAVGFGINQKEACLPVIIEKNGIRLAIFASVLLPLENWSPLADSACMCQTRVEDLAGEIASYRKVHPNDKVMVYLHWGVEFQPFPNIRQKQEAHQLIDAGADAIIGAHPHVVQPLSYYRAKPVFYSLGNFVFDQKRPGTDQAVIAALRITKDKVMASSIPIKIDSCVPKLEELQEEGK